MLSTARVGLVRVPGDLEQPLAEEEHHPGIVGGTELPVDGQAQQVAVEAAAAVQVAGPQQDPAAQNVHASISASRQVRREVRENARSPPLCGSVAFHRAKQNDAQIWAFCDR